jgi:hypothetical protein
MVACTCMNNYETWVEISHRSYNESIYMETKYIFGKELGLNNMFNSILWYMYFV